MCLMLESKRGPEHSSKFKYMKNCKNMLHSFPRFTTIHVMKQTGLILSCKVLELMRADAGMGQPRAQQRGADYV